MDQLHIACERGDLQMVTSLLSNEKWDINTRNTDGEYPLHIACKYGHLEIVKVLQSDQKCILNIQNRYGDTPLHLACKGKSLPIIKFLLEKRCKTNISNRKGETVLNIPLNEDGDCLLHIACQWGNVNIVWYLITGLGRNINIQNTNLNTALHIACYQQSLTIIKVLLQMRCSTKIPNKKGKTAQDIPLNNEGDCLLHIACQWGDVDIVRYLIIGEGCNPNLQSSTSGNTPLHNAAKWGQDETIDQLLSHECNPNFPNKDGDAPLHTAVRWNKAAAITKLLAHQQCNINVQNKVGDTPLHIAARGGKTALVSQLLAAKKCDPNIQNTEAETPLHTAVRQGQDDTIVQLLSCKECNPNVKNKEGNTTLHIACYRKCLDIIRVQLESKCSTNIPNMKGETAQNIPLNKDGDCILHVACRWGEMDIVRYLITDEKCNLNIPNKYLNTPLHVACYVKALSIIKFLLERRCNTTIPNKKGETAQHILLNEDGDCLLHFACQWDDVEIVRFLIIDERYDLNIQNRSLNTPLHIACNVKLLTIIRFLLEMRCSTNIPNIEGETAQDIRLNEDGDLLLHIACQWGDVDIVRYLITDERCNPNVQNSSPENTPLPNAAKYGQDGKCHINVQNKNGDTPLHIAARENKTPVFKCETECRSWNLGVNGVVVYLDRDGDIP